MKRAAEVFSEGFMEDPLYNVIFSDEYKRRKALQIFFKNYCKFLSEYSDFNAYSSNMESLAMWYYSDRYDSNFKYRAKTYKAIIKSLEMCRYISFKEFKRGLSILRKMDSRWIEEEVSGEYIHLDMFVVDKNHRGKKLMGKMMRPIINHEKHRNKSFTLETHNKRNVQLYSHFGFQLVREIKLEGTELTQYCMVLDRKESRQ